MTESGKKLAILLPRFAGGGAERVSVVLARSLRAFGYQTELWATRFDPRKRAALEAEGIATASPRDIAGKVRHRSRRTTVIVAHMVQERAVDILVVAVSPLGFMTELRRRVGERCRIVFHLHGQPFWELVPFATELPAPRSVAEAASRCLSFLKRDLKEKLFGTYTRRANKLYRATYEACDAYVVLCEAYKKELEKRLGIMPEDSKVTAISNPVATLKELLALRGCPRQREVLYVGRLTADDKRVDRLLRIWKRVCADYPEWLLRIVGDGPERRNLEVLSRKLGIRNVRFEGYADPKPYYAEAEIVALTSTFEGWPGSLLEGLAAGCRIIAFDCSAGVAEILAEGRGVAVAPFDEDEYARSLAAMMDEYPHKPSEKTAAWLGRFSDENVAAAWHKVFLKISK